MSLEFTLNRLESSEERYIKFIDSNIVDWSEQEILEPAKKRALEFGLSSNAVNGMGIEKVSLMKTILVWEYRGPNGEPLHQFLENGFGKGGYDIHAKGKLFGGADHLKWKDKSGKNIFRKKVRHPGFDGYQILQTTWDDKKPFLRRRIITETNNFFQVNKL